MRWYEILEQPMVSNIVMGVFSTVAAILFFVIGGSVAEVTGQENNLLQVTFEAGGALAGFIIVFSLSHRAYGRILEMGGNSQKRLREYILRIPADGYNPQDPGLACQYKLYNREEGGWDESWKPIGFIKGGEGSLQVYVAEMTEDNTIRFKLRDSNGDAWHSSEDLSFGVTPVHMEQVNGNE